MSLLTGGGSIAAVLNGENVLAYVMLFCNVAILLVNCAVEVYRRWRDRDKDLKSDGKEKKGQMKKMWSEEEVNAAIAEYAATHPAGGKLFLHNVSFYDDNVSHDWDLRILSTEESPFTSFEDIIGKVVSLSGDNGASSIVLAVGNDDMNYPSIWYINDNSTLDKSTEPMVSNFVDVVTAL